MVLALPYPADQSQAVNQRVSAPTYLVAAAIGDNLLLSDPLLCHFMIAYTDQLLMDKKI